MSFESDVYDKFAEKREAELSRYDKPRDTFKAQSEYYREAYGKKWTSHMATDLQAAGITTKHASIVRQLNRFEAKETGSKSQARSVGAKYMEAIKSQAPKLPPKREIPEGTKVKLKYEIRAYFRISATAGWRTIKGELDSEELGENTLADILDAYAEGGSIDGQEWLDSLEDLGNINISAA